MQRAPLAVQRARLTRRGAQGAKGGERSAHAWSLMVMREYLVAVMGNGSAAERCCARARSRDQQCMGVYCAS